MIVKKTEIHSDLMIHPGKMIINQLRVHGITQAELSVRAGVSPAYVSNVVAGKKGISAKFAVALEYVFGISKSVWLHLQADYESALLEKEEEQTITEEERDVREELTEIVDTLKQRKMLPMGEEKDASILSLRKVLQISNLKNIRKMIPFGADRITTKTNVNSNIVGAWVCLCQITESKEAITTKFAGCNQTAFIHELKEMMCRKNADISQDIKELMRKYGIDFSIEKVYQGVPVKGYLAQKREGIYRMVLNAEKDFTEKFWRTLFHEIGHIVNGDVGKKAGYIDDGEDSYKEQAADFFADRMLLSAESYEGFLQEGAFTVKAIRDYAKSQNVMPYIVIERLRREGYLRENPDISS